MHFLNFIISSALYSELLTNSGKPCCIIKMLFVIYHCYYYICEGSLICLSSSLQWIVESLPVLPYLCFSRVNSGDFAYMVVFRVLKTHFTQWQSRLKSINECCQYFTNHCLVLWDFVLHAVQELKYFLKVTCFQEKPVLLVQYL